MTRSPHDPHAGAGGATPDLEIGATVLVESGLVFAEPDGYRPLELDLYVPEDLETPAPLLVFVHGGGWSRGSRRSFGPTFDECFFARIAAARGYVVASIDYRLSGEARFPAQLEDVHAALDWLSDHASAHGADIARTVLWGESAGGHLAALAALTRDSTSPVTQPVGLVGVVDWYGPSDLTTMAAQAPADAVSRADDVDSREARLLGGPVAEAGELAAQASPVTYVRADAPPFLLVHGTHDRFVPVGQSEQFHAALEAVGASSRLELVEGADHAWHDTDPEAVLARSLEFVAQITSA